MSDAKAETVVEPTPTSATAAPVDTEAVVEKETIDATPTEKTEEKSDEKSEEKPEDKSEQKSEEKSEKKDYGRNGRKPFNNRGGKRGDYETAKYRGGKNSKFDPTSMSVTDDASKIRAQVEFYFGDANLPTDKYMWETTDGSSNKPVPIKTLHSFKRMQRFQPYSAVVDALKESTFLEVSGEEGEEVIKRKNAYDPNSKDIARDRTLYVKGFGEEKPSTQFDIEAFFTVYGPTNMVRLRRHEDGLFKGSVFVEFSEEKTAQDFLKLEPKPLWEGKDELKVMSKSEYMEEKTKLIKEGKMEPNQTRPFFGPRDGKTQGRGGRGDFRGKDRGDRDPDDWKRRRDDDQKSGFRDNKRGRGNRDGGRGGRGGRGRGNDRNRRNRRDESRDGDKEEATEGTKKRAREDEAGDEVPVKKQDTKEVAAEAS